MVNIPPDKIHSHTIHHEAGGVVTITVAVMGGASDPALVELQRQLTEAWSGHVTRLRPVQSRWDTDQGDDVE